ncbi:hypothetical protein SAMN06266787_10827 [Halorubrum ezzemoulense]|jgi:hypothetical protein|uniref:Uncharacterized protein n=1 Tax=Halorubrum ezzemoulense TaxID=337243 RepID=A0A238Y461_HALEZ|nr:hypothetical protein [Halorubrum ezzemoulense]SNR65453.1 hypothetical protein SAMN06266787_10827 [Halorubrum ezzemoulense]
MEEPATFKRLRNADVAVVHDNVDQQYWWMLRSLPAIEYLNYSTFTYPTSWRTLNTGGEFQSYSNQYDYLEYDYKVLGQLEEETFTDDLVVITTEYYEGETDYPIDHLVSRYASLSETLLVVTNSKRFTPRGGQRPLYQEQFVESLGSYKRLYTAYESVYDSAGWGLPLMDTRNLFLQDNANLYEFVTGEAIETTRDLFAVLPDAPYLPLYDVFGAIFGREDDYGSVPLDEDDVHGLQRWLLRRIEWDRETAQEVAEELNRSVTRDGKTFDLSYATPHRSPILREATEKADEIDHQKSSIHKRYHAWLQQDNQ